MMKPDCKRVVTSYPGRLMRCFASALLVVALVGIGTPAIPRTRMSRNEGEVWRGELQEAFAPIGKVVIQVLTLDQLEGAGYGLSFYVGWGQSNSALYTQVRSYRQSFSRASELARRPRV